MVISGPDERMPVDSRVAGELEAAAPSDADTRPTPVQVRRPVPDFRPVLAILAAFGVAYYFALTRLVRGDLVNSYPFVWVDSFDWLVEGLAVARWFDGVAIPELPAVRSPGFVGVTFADYHLGANGGILFGVIALAVVVPLAAMLALAWWERTPRYQATVVVLVLAVSPLGFYRMWILADQFATAWLVVAVVALYPYATRGGRGWLVGATVAAVLGGSTQLYGVVPFLVAGGWCLAVSVWRRKPDYLLASALGFAIGMVAIVSMLWRAQVPHAGVPPQLELIEFSFDMLDFYANVWSYAFAPLLPLLGVLVAYRWREVAASPLLTGYWLAVLTLMGSTFFYQYRDFRFTLPTSLMLGVAIMATLPGERPLPRAPALMAATAGIALFLGLVLAPAGYVRPRWSELELKPSETHFAMLLTAEPVDRFSLAVSCQPDQFCPQVLLRLHDTSYERSLLGIYRHLVNADSSTPVEDYSEALHNGYFEQRNTNDCCEADTLLAFGRSGDRPVVGDWDGLPAASPPDPKAGTDTPGVFRNGLWLLRDTNSPGPADLSFGFGQAGDVPVVGDWDGDGVDTIGVFRSGVWTLRNSNSAGPADLEFGFGQAGDVPVVGDWDGDGIDTVAVYRDGQWLLRNSNTEGPFDFRFDFGGKRDRPVSGDWNGDGVDTIGIFKEGLWKLRNRNPGGRGDLEFYFGAFTHLPLTGDWSNTGTDTVGIAR